MAKNVQYSSGSFWLRPSGLLMFAMLPGYLFAQRDTTKKLKEVKVSSSIPTLQTLAPTQSISATDFVHYNALNVADAIRDFSGVIIKDYGGIGGLKTVSVRGLGANHTEVLFDGVQVSDAENGQIDLGKFNLNNVQEITLYNGQPTDICMPARSFASASVLSIKTIKPNLTEAKPYLITAGLKAGSFGLINPYLQLQQRLNNRWSYIINGYTENADGNYKYIENNGNSSEQQTRIGSAVATQQADGALYWAKNDSDKFSLHVNYYNSSRGLPGAVILYNPPPSGQHLWDQDLFLQSGYEHKWQNSLHLLLNAKVSHTYLRYLDPNFSNEAGKLDQHFTQREYYGSAALSYHLMSNWELSYAADIALNNLDADIAFFHYPTRVTLLNVLASNYVYGKLTLQASLLNTNITETVRSGNAEPSRNVYSPTLMASLKPFDKSAFLVRAFYKYIFRVPTFNDLYYAVVNTPNLKPESTHQYDVGLSYNKSLTGVFDYIALITDAYYNDVTNKLVYKPSVGNGSVENFGKVAIEGLDASVKTQGKIGAGFKISLSANYSYQLVQDITNPASSTYLNQLPYIPKNTAALNAGISKAKFGLYYNQVISSSRYYNNNNTPDDLLPAYAISDASFVYKSAINKIPVMASFEASNLFNKNYVVVQSYPMPGRSYRISFQITI